MNRNSDRTEYIALSYTYVANHDLVYVNNDIRMYVYILTFLVDMHYYISFTYHTYINYFFVSSYLQEQL